MVSAPNEQADNLPGVTSAVQSYWQGATEGWEDRVLQLHGGNGGPLGYADEDKPAPNDAAWVASGAVPPPKNDAGNGHVWVRVVGRESESDITSTIGNTTYDGGFDESLLAVEGGIDGAVQLNGSTMFLGLMGGYADSSIDFDDTTTKAKIDGPMLGAYLSWVKNNFYLDVLTKADFLNVDYTAEAGSDSMDGLSLGVRADVGYRVDLARNWFIVPSAMLAYVNTSVDDMNIADTDIRFQDGESLRAKAGFRLGNTFRSAGGTVFEPYISLAVGNEFLGDNKAFIDSNGYTLTAASDVSGLYGEVGAGYKVAFGGSHVTGFGRGYYRFADGYESVTGQLGLSYGW
jgi:outer membrane autotransporter protein